MEIHFPVSVAKQPRLSFNRSVGDFFHILERVLPVLLVMVGGAIIRKVGILNSAADQTLMQLVIYILIPAFILDNILANDALRSPANLFWAPLLGFLCGATGLWCCWRIAPLFGLPRSSPQARAFGFTTGLFNYGYIPLPYVFFVYGGVMVGILFAFNLGVEISFWTVGLAILEGRGLFREWRRALTPPVCSILIGTVLNLISFHFGITLNEPTLSRSFWGYPWAILLQTIHLIGYCATPLALLLIGATMADFWAEFLSTFRRAHSWGILLGAITLRHLVLPLLFLTLATLAPISHELRIILVIQAAMPAANLPLVVVRNVGGDVRIALQVIFGSSAVAVITLPLWLQAGLEWLTYCRL